MKALLAIAKLTVRSSVRSRVVHLVLFLILVTVFVLPLTLVGDGTAYGQLQLSLTYTLGLVGILLSVVTLWLGCTVVADDIERHQIHLVVSKPVPRYVFWMGKLLGITFLQFVLLAIAAGGIYGLVFWRLNTSVFQAAELDQLKNEVLVGRRLYGPRKIDVDRLVQMEFKRRVEADLIPEVMMKTPHMVESEIRRQVKARITEVPAQVRRPWVFNNLPVITENERMYFRYRMYVDKVSAKNQREIVGMWWLRNPADGKFYPYVQKAMSGKFHELVIPPEAVAEDGSVALMYENLDQQGKSVIFQADDGPHILLKVTGFGQNYLRVITLIFFQVFFLGIIACACGGSFSVPSAIFLSFSYVLIGLALVSMEPATPEDEIIPTQFIQLGAYQVRQLTSYITVSLNEFNEITKLAKGELIEIPHMLRIFFDVVLLRGLPIALLGIFMLNRRELGTVIRR